ncbi:hypothetical protein [Melioribacter roseus]|uniref:hypothetical protein n=1 Tax=Melioribacter roseus TaxID=1134405 RepID=UPI0012FED735|nr:hypothetical protein [Melioribacter roseus]
MMNKIIMQFGLLVFFFSVIYFVQKGLDVTRVILNSLSIFLLLTIMLSFVAISLIKAINRNSLEKIKEPSGKDSNE